MTKFATSHQLWILKNPLSGLRNIWEANDAMEASVVEMSDTKGGL